MFNVKNVKVLSIGISAIALAATIGYTAVANSAEMKAAVSKPIIRDTYKGSDKILLDGAVSLTNGNRKINVSLRDSDLRQTLRMIADKAGLNIVFHSSVTGKVTLDLVNVTLNDAFKMIMQANDLSYMLDNDTLLVMSREASLTSDVMKKNMMVIPVRYVDSKDIADFLNKNVFSTNRPGLSNSNIVVTNPSTNELILFGSDNDYKMAQKIVAKLDVQPRVASFRINYTTPEEMAGMICDSLFPNATKQKGSGAGGAGGGDGMEPSSPGLFEGVATGAASDMGGEGGGSGGESGGSSKKSLDEKIELNKTQVACSLKGAVSADKLASLGKNALTVSYSKQGGSVTLSGGSEAQIEMVRNFIKGNDKKQPQAYVDLQIVQLNEVGSKELYNSWTMLSPFFSATFGSGTNGRLTTDNDYPMFFKGHGYNVVTTTTTEGTDGGSDTSTSINPIQRWNGGTQLHLAIDYLIKNGKGRTLANPKVIVTNGKKSTINLTSDYIKTTTAQIMASTGSGISTGVQKTYEIGDDEGIQVEMVPYISPDGYVTLNIIPSYSSLKEKVMDSFMGEPIIAATLLDRRNLELSNVRIKDGETLVIGGLIKETETKTVAKLPLLGDLPVVGSFFRNTATQNSKNEIVIVLTPRILKDSDDAQNQDNL